MVRPIQFLKQQIDRYYKAALIVFVLFFACVAYIEHNILDFHPVRDNLSAFESRLVGFLDKGTDNRFGGMRKFYYTEEGYFGPDVVSVYTSSYLYTKQLNGDTDLDALDFLLSLQDKVGRTDGAFYYSRNLETGDIDERFLVGTNAKVIISLLQAYSITGDDKYLTSAKKSADFILTMQRDDGWFDSQLRKSKDGTLLRTKKVSLLYNGQVLRAFSQIYEISKDEKYYESAGKVASNLKERVNREGCLLGDDYRKPNPISSAWVVFSLREFSFSDGEYKDIYMNCADYLLELRKSEMKSSSQSRGSWPGVYSSSGASWMAEVYSFLYRDCVSVGERGCKRYVKPIIETLWWIQGHEREPGRLVWSHASDSYVRMDTLSHTIAALRALF
ncbi:MAG: terpene cyclase/mutase family protein [bacterium]|nr:terpene cyclase/mutase family protein [bacterium]